MFNKKLIPSFTFETEIGPIIDCECCGAYNYYGELIYLGKELIWYSKTDNHLWSEESENNLVVSVINAWDNYLCSEIKNNFTEEARLDWNKKYPGNYIASKPEAWEEHNQTLLKYQKEQKEELIRNCSNLPEESLLQLKMILLWLENYAGEPMALKIKEKIIK